MPLLSRHKSSSGSNPSPPSKSKATATSAIRAMTSKTSTRGSPPNLSPTHKGPTPGSGSKALLCESPLFGTRRQLDISNQNDKDSGSIPQQITRQQIHYAFSIMDTNSDGLIDLRDLSQMLANLGVPIDEAILSHVMSKVTKRGDQLIGEAEFLDWISQVIKVSDSSSSPTQTKRLNSTTNKSTITSLGSQRRSTTKTRGVARSSTAISSLTAEPSESPRARRGSGSGLALMRSLSSGSTGANLAKGNVERSSCGGGSEPNVNSLTKCQTGAVSCSSNSLSSTTESAAEDEARNDLKAAFCVFDLDGDGYITLDEVHSGLKLLGESWSTAELSLLFAKCSTAGSSSKAEDLEGQRISIDDFVQLLL